MRRAECREMQYIWIDKNTTFFDLHVEKWPKDVKECE